MRTGRNMSAIVALFCFGVFWVFFACNTFVLHTHMHVCPLRSKTKLYFPPANQNLGNEPD